MAKIFIGIPTYKPLDIFEESLTTFLQEIKCKHEVEVYRTEGMTLVDAQNDIADKFLVSDKEYLLFLEEDHWGHTADMLESLISANTYMCAMNYYSRHAGKMSCLLQYTGNKDYRKRYKELPYTSGIHECDLVPFGMTLIKRELFSILSKPYFKLNSYSQFVDGVRATDQAFCYDLMSHGIKPMGCFDYVLPHREITKDNYIQFRKQDILDSFEDAQYKVTKFYIDTVIKNRNKRNNELKVATV